MDQIDELDQFDNSATNKKNWKTFFDRHFQSKETARVYKTRVNQFEQWFEKKKRNTRSLVKLEVDDRIVAEYINVQCNSYNEKLHARAALKARFVVFEGMKLEFPKLR